VPIVLYWRPGPGAPLWAAVFGRDTPIAVVPEGLNQRLLEWNARYHADKVPDREDGDPAWLREGVGLLAEVRRALGDGYRVEATDPWWPDDPAAGS
jgi:hypothetical protein